MPERTGVIVTGGSSGIGLATAIAYARRGADVGLVARTPDTLESASDAVRRACASTGQLVEVRVADLSDRGQTADALNGLLGTGIEPDILINSAGVITVGEFATMSDEDFASNIQCGFWSVVHPCKELVGVMLDRGRGHIVNVSSVAGFLGIYGYASYSASKYAVMGFTEALRCEMKPHGVGVSIVCPPDTDTPALTREKTMRPPETDAITGTIKAISPDAVADAIVRGVDKGRYYIIPDAQSRLYFRLKGLMPELFFRIVDGDVRKVRKQG